MTWYKEVARLMISMGCGIRVQWCVLHPTLKKPALMSPPQ